MSRTLNRAGGDIVLDFLSVAGLLEKPQLAQYAYLTREEEAIVRDVLFDLELAQGTAYSYVTRLVNVGDDEV